MWVPRCAVSRTSEGVTLAGGARPGGRVMLYDDVAPVALADDLEELRGCQMMCWAPGADDERNSWLGARRHGSSAYRSYVATADAMILHRNTIQYRVIQAMELCGQNLPTIPMPRFGADGAGGLLR